MEEILHQLGLDQTFFIQMAIFVAVFLFLSNIYFKPFLKLFEARHQRTVKDRDEAERMMNEAQGKFDEYKKRLNEERVSARQEYDALLLEAKKQEATLLAGARAEAKKITQDAAESIQQQRAQLRKGLDADVEQFAKNISETLLLRRE